MEPEGKLLTLTASQALEVGYSEGTVKNLDELLAKIGFAGAEVQTVEKTFSERVAEFVTNPFVVPILLSIGSLGLIIELYTPGFGLPGLAGITALYYFLRPLYRRIGRCSRLFYS